MKWRHTYELKNLEYFDHDELVLSLATEMTIYLLPYELKEFYETLKIFWFLFLLVANYKMQMMTNNFQYE